MSGDNAPGGHIKRSVSHFLLNESGQFEWQRKVGNILPGQVICAGFSIVI